MLPCAAHIGSDIALSRFYHRYYSTDENLVNIGKAFSYSILEAPALKCKITF